MPLNEADLQSGPRRWGRRNVALGFVMLAFGLPLGPSTTAQAHLGGEVVRPVFLTPAPAMTTVQEGFTVSWNDPDSDPTGVLHFYLQASSNVPPEAEPESVLLSGIEVGTVAVSDTTDALAVDTSTVGPGVYTLYAVTTDPPLCDQVTPLFATITVADPDPTAVPPLTALWRNPRDPLTTISGIYAARLSVRSLESPMFSMEVGRMVPILDGDSADPCSQRQRFESLQVLAENVAAVPDTEGGANLWTAKYVWGDASALGSGTYVLRATVKAGTETLTLFAPGVVEVLESPEPGPEAAESVADQASDATSAGDVGSSDGGNEDTSKPSADGGNDALGGGSGCGAAPGEPSGWPGMMSLLLVSLAFGWWRLRGVAARHRGQSGSGGVKRVGGAMFLLAALTAFAPLASCVQEPVEPTMLTREQMLDPLTCAVCHKKHYDEWAGSMHAYAGDDPVFLALNAKAVRDDDVGDFCVKCHAPMALAEGATVDGTNLPDVPQHLKGVTCYFCHAVESVEGTHNNPLKLGLDTVMRGSYKDPLANVGHPSAYSALHDRKSLESAKLCGACHDIVNPKGLHIERTYSEWQGSLYSKDDPSQQLTCSQCHMPGSDRVAADYPNAVTRRVHDHSMPGVDVALTPWPGAEAQRALIQTDLDNTVRAQLCVFENAGGVAVWVTLENVGAGHSFPSGATQDRRAWVEVLAFEGQNEVWSSGKIGEDQSLEEVAANDAQLFRLGDVLVDGEGEETHDFWSAEGYTSNLLPAPTARSPVDPAYIDTHVLHQYVLPTALPSRVTMRLRVRPMGFEILDELVADGLLEQSIRDAMPTWTLGPTVIEWRADSGEACNPTTF